MVSDNIKIGEFRITIPRRLKGVEGFAVRISYDTSGLIEVEATVHSTQKKASIVISENVSNKSEKEIEASLKKLQALKIHPKDDELNIEILARLNRLFAMASGEDRRYIGTLIAQFKGVMERQNLKEIEVHRGQLSEVIKEIDNFYVS